MITSNTHTGNATILPDLEPPISLTISPPPIIDLKKAEPTDVVSKKVKMSNYDNTKFPKNTAKIITFDLL